MQIKANIKRKLFDDFLVKGSIFINKFEEIDHSKYFIAIGLSEDKLLTCSVYINSEIHPSIFRKPEILDLQVPIKKENYAFLKWDSFVCCSSPLYFKADSIFKWKEIGTCRQIGEINKADLNTICKAIIDSGLLSEEEIELYFG